MATLACERGLAAAGRMVKVESLEFIHSRLGDRDIGICPPVGSRQRFREDCPASPKNGPVPPQLDESLAQISRIEDERTFPPQAMATIAPEFAPQRTAFERMDAFVRAYQLEPQQRSQGRPGTAARRGRSPPQNGADMLRAVEGFPSRAIRILPLGIRHSGMMADASIEIVFVHVGVHPDPLLPENLVVLRAGQGSKKKQFQNIERQLALDDLDIAQDRGPGITGEADDVTGTGDGAVTAPLLQHLPVVGNLVLALLGRNEVVRIDVLQPNEDTAHAGGGRLLDEIRDLVAKRIDLNGKADVR